MSVDHECQRLTHAIAVCAQHLGQNATPFGHATALFTRIFAPDDEGRNRVWAVPSQRAPARQRRPQRSISDTHAIGQPGFLDARLCLLPVLVPREFPNGTTTGQAQAVSPRRWSDERHHVVIRHRGQRVRQGYHPFSLRHTLSPGTGSLGQPFHRPFTILPDKENVPTILEQSPHVGARTFLDPPASPHRPGALHTDDCNAPSPP